MSLESLNQAHRGHLRSSQMVVIKGLHHVNNSLHHEALNIGAAGVAYNLWLSQDLDRGREFSPTAGEKVSICNHDYGRLYNF